MATAQGGTQVTVFPCSWDFAKCPLARVFLTSPGELSNEITVLKTETSDRDSGYSLISPSPLKGD